MEAPGIETDLGQLEGTEEHRSVTISTDADPANVSDRASKCAIVRGVVTESSEAYELSNVVETALAKALVLAAEAKRCLSFVQPGPRRHGQGPAEFAEVSGRQGHPYPLQGRHTASRNRPISLARDSGLPRAAMRTRRPSHVRRQRSDGRRRRGQGCDLPAVRG